MLMEEPLSIPVVYALEVKRELNLPLIRMRVHLPDQRVMQCISKADICGRLRVKR